ncbi:hypothetical protein Mpsy_1405 [Methanolobus psychrophilus R15]|nr:hypothetical protein Mpsy_1405 [Methanolobus psychrophilus R15]
MIKKTLLVLVVLSLLLAGTASASDIGTVPPSMGPMTMSMSLASATSENVVDNGDGTFTYTQTIDQYSTAPHYTAPPNGGGFGIYSWYDEDYGWKHTFDKCGEPNLTIYSVELEIRAWDVDAEPYHGLDGEYDHITADGVDLDPVYLQGNDGQWSLTTFDVNPALLMDDCALNIWIDIDMYHDSDYWATELDYSKLIVTYTLDGSNRVPYEPVVEKTPSGCVATTDDLIAMVTGPNPSDPDEDNVTYTYRWFVDIGTGGFLDDEFAKGIDHTGNNVPAADTEVGEIWMVRITPVDEHGARGPFVEVVFNEIVEDCPTGGSNGEIPEFPTVMLPMAAIIGLALIFQNRRKE